MPKEIPILFSTPMVEAILEERKTMTRRTTGLSVVNDGPDSWLPVLFYISTNGNHYMRFEKQIENGPTFVQNVRCPYGNDGDLLYVRETWQHTKSAINLSLDDENSGYIYKASQNGRDWESNTEEWTWKPGIHLPKEGSRIWLKVTSVTVERLHDITEEDAKAEGVMQNPDGSWHDYLEPERLWQDCARASFESLWDSINGKEHPWKNNDWLFVVSFEVISTTGKPTEETTDERSVATVAQ